MALGITPQMTVKPSAKTHANGQVAQNQPASALKAPEVSKPQTGAAANLYEGAAKAAGPDGDKVPLSARKPAQGAMGHMAMVMAMKTGAPVGKAAAPGVPEVTPVWFKGMMPVADIKALNTVMSTTLDDTLTLLQKPSASPQERAAVKGRFAELAAAYARVGDPRWVPEARTEVVTTHEYHGPNQSPFFGGPQANLFGAEISTETIRYGFKEPREARKLTEGMVAYLNALSAAVDESLQTPGPIAGEKTVVELGERERQVGTTTKRNFLGINKEIPVMEQYRETVTVNAEDTVQMSVAALRTQAQALMDVANAVNQNGLTEVKLG